MKLLIIEDEKIAADYLVKMVEDNFSEHEIVGVVDNVKDASKIIHSRNPDLVVMDINLRDHLSFDLFDYLDHRSLNVIFTTSYREFAMKAFKFEALDYIMKPIKAEDFAAAIRKADEKIFLRQKMAEMAGGEDGGMLVVWENDQLIRLHLNEIAKIKADGPYSSIFLTSNKQVYTSKHLGGYEEILQNKGFLRVHNSCLVNIKHIVSYTPGAKAYVTVLNNGDEPVSKLKKRDVLRTLNTSPTPEE